jgi:hypothetical protein
MKNTLLFVIVLIFAQYSKSHAQLPSLGPEFPLPTTAIPGAWSAGASTLQLINDPTLGGVPRNFYTHCWDEGDQYGVCDGGIAWRITRPDGSLVNQGHIPMIGYDIDVANFVGPDGRIRVLVAFFRANAGGDPGGYYYRIYRFQAGTLIPETPDITLAPTSWFCGGINVDANIEDMGLAITWSRNGQVYVTAAYSNAVFGMPVYIASLPDYSAPDVSIGAYGGTRNLYIAARSTGDIQAISLPFDAVVGGGGTPVSEGSYTPPPGVSLYSDPRIDCPDRFTHKKWAVVFGELDNTSSSTVVENVRALVKNTNTAFIAMPIIVHSYATSPVYNYISAQPVLAYYDQADSFQVGWMSRHYSVDSGSIGNNGRYLTKTVGDNDGTFPIAPLPTYRYIDLAASNSAHALAFSGQNLRSAYNGIYAAFSQRPTSTVTRMMYKSRPWGTLGFRPSNNLPAENGNGLPENKIGTGTEVSVYPNPFLDRINITIPLSGEFDIHLFTTDGRSVYHKSGNFNAGQNIELPTKELANGIYMLQVTSPKLGIDHKTKLTK